MSENLETTDPDKGIKKKSDQSRLKARLRDLEFFTEVIPDGVVIINNLLIVEASNESAQSLWDAGGLQASPLKNSLRFLD